MHKYLQAIGITNLKDRKNLRELLHDCVLHYDTYSYTVNKDNILLGEFCKNFAENMGIAVCGEFDDDGKFILDYYYPYLRGGGITSREDVSIERHAAKISYAGVCDDVNVGMTLIFYLANMIPYIKAEAMNKLPIRGTTVTLSALSTEGRIMIPLMKDKQQIERGKLDSINRSNLLAAARNGDEEAMETLTFDDVNLYTIISRKILVEDIYSLVDTYFMPTGVECDQYAVLGEIVNLKKTINNITNDEIYILTLFCNDITFDICINSKDLYGEPAIGRRFKGIIWLQGVVNYPEISI